ncbi:MAG: ABC transporter ATP-binding protein [Candidatus Heimdallarchaeaceae archaeon]
MPFIEIRDLIKIYQTKESLVRIPALRGVELEVNEGEFISIIGPSGSGKTTLLLVLAGMTEPSAGIVRVGDMRLDKFTDTERRLYRRNKVGTLWQLPSRNLIWELPILENVEIPLRLLGIPREARLERAKELLTEVGLEKRMEHTPKQLSGGEVQRAGLACALAHNPQLLLADEPTGELDTKTAGELMQYFKHLNEVTGITAIMVTHDFDVAKTTDRLVQIVDGRISGYSATSKLKSLKDLNRVYIDSYGSLQLPRHVKEQFKLQEEVKLSIEDGKVILSQED